MAIEREELWDAFLRYDREIAQPRLDAALQHTERTLRNEMNTHFDAMYKRFDNIDSELVAIKAGLKRLEGRMDAVEARLDAIESRPTSVEKQLEAAALPSDIIELQDAQAPIEPRPPAPE